MNRTFIAFFVIFFHMSISIAHQGGGDDNGAYLNRSTSINHCHRDACVSLQLNNLLVTEKK